MGYTKSAISGITWMSGVRMTSRALTFIKIAFLARLLTPSQFGVFGIASLLLAFLEILTETGINIILIQTKDTVDKYVDSAWVVSILRGVVIFLLLFISAPFVASFFNTPSSLNIIRLISFAPLIKGFINPAEVILQKDLKFNYEFWFRTSLFFIDALVAIIAAFLTHSVYSLALGLLAGSILEVVISFAFIKPLPKFKLDTHYIKEIFNKGKWITAYSIFNYIGENGDNIVVGKILGASSLGLYQMAYKVSYLPISEVSDVVNKVVFPVYSKIQEDQKRLVQAFLKTTGMVSLLTICIGAIIFTFPTQIINIVLGPQWQGAAIVLRVLSLYGIIRAVISPASAIFLALGKQNYVTVMIFVRCLVLALTIYPFVVNFGLIGAGYSALLSAAAEFPVILVLIYKIARN